jgi:hypothetical protein
MENPKLQNLMMVQSIASDSNYKRPKQTKQDKLSYEEIKELLKNYSKVKDLSTVPLGTHIRYVESKLNPFTNKFERKFRLGGYLINNKNSDKYIVLSNGSLKWSVQVKDTVFYKSNLKDEEKVSHTENGLENDKLQEEITKLKDLLVEKELTIKKLKEKIKELKALKKKK